MSSAPYGVRLLVGVAATALEETRKLPQTILMYPMTVVSQLAHLVMKMQQDVADLVIKGDATLENLFPPKDEQPEWADVRRGRATRRGLRRGRRRRRRADDRGPVRAVLGAARHPRPPTVDRQMAPRRAPSTRTRRRSPQRSTTTR